jgi:GTPase SAR1 family protein
MGNNMGDEKNENFKKEELKIILLGTCCSGKTSLLFFF